MAGERDDDSKRLSNRLYQAIRNDELEHVRICIEQGVDVNRQCYSEMDGEMYPLELACRYGHEEVMEELLKGGAHPNQVSGWSRRSRWNHLSAINIAAKERVLTLSMMRCLISHGADVDFKDTTGDTILHYLARGEFSDTRDNLLSAAELVLDNGASVDARDDDDRTPLYWACSSGNIDLVNLFIAEGADVNSDIGDLGNEYRNMLTRAADVCNIAVFDVLLNAGANRHLTPDDLINPCSTNNYALIARILDINMEIDRYIRLVRPTLDNFGMTILHYACSADCITSETVRLLLDHGADVRAVSDEGNTALHYAAKNCLWGGNKIRQLLSYNPPLNIRNTRNRSPLVELIQSLITIQSSPSPVDPPSLLYRLYVRQCKVSNFKLLVAAGAKVTADVELKLIQLRTRPSEADRSDLEISLKSLKEVCRSVIRGTIRVPVDSNVCELPIPEQFREYLNFPELD